MADKTLFSSLGKTHTDKFTAIAIILLIVVVVFFVIKFGYDKIRTIINQTKYDADLKDEIIKGGGLTLNESQYKLLADKLYMAMDGLGTNNDNIYAVFNAINTKADLLKLIAVFGIREDENLSEWLYGEWGSTSRNNKINTILAMKGIDYSF